MKLLVIRFSSIGDIVLTSPVIRCIKKQLPHAEIHYLTKPAYKQLLEANIYLDGLHLLAPDINETIDALRAEKFDCIIDLHKNLRSLKVKRALNVRSYSFQKLNIRKWLLVNLRLNAMPDESIVERYLQTVKPLGVKNDGGGLDYFIPEAVEIKQDDVPMSHWVGFAACVIGGSYATKKFPAEKWRKVIDLLPFPVILLGGSEDRQEGDSIAKGDSVKIYNACGKFNLHESARLIESAKVVVSNDTGLMHIAAAFHKPIVSLWGNTAPEMGMFPYYGHNDLRKKPSGKSILIENWKLGCHPCSKLGYERCPRGHFKCMQELEELEIAGAVQNFWKFTQL